MGLRETFKDKFTLIFDQMMFLLLFQRYLHYTLITSLHMLDPAEQVILSRVFLLFVASSNLSFHSRWMLHRIDCAGNIFGLSTLLNDRFPFRRGHCRDEPLIPRHFLNVPSVICA
jgi:hypothetical protein